MGIYNRADGKYIKDLPDYTKFMPFLMPRRHDASIYFRQQIDLRRTLEYMSEKDVKIFHIYIAALHKLGVTRPVFNRFVAGSRVYQRNYMSFGFVAKQELTTGAREVNIRLDLEDDDNLDDVIRKINEKVSIVKTGGDFDADDDIAILTKIPKWMTSFIFFVLGRINRLGLLSKKFIKSNPLFVSAYVTNVGSIGIDAPFHHMYEFGTTSVFSSLGVIHKDYIVGEDGSAGVSDVVNVTFTIDERIADGVHMAKGLADFRKFMENPELLE